MYRSKSIARQTIMTLLVAAGLYGMCAPAAVASDVSLMVDGQRGQGMLQRRGDECLIITPAHVASGKPLAGAFSEIVATFSDRREVNTTVFESYAEDIALLRLEVQPSDGCTERAFNEDKLSAMLKSATEGVLKYRNETGSAQLLQVDIVGHDDHRLIQIEPRSSSKSIKQGFSGSVLFINSQPVGMLITNVKSENESGVESEVGQVLRADMINATINPFFQAAQGDRSFHIELDAVSEFLLPDLNTLAREQKLAVGQNPDTTTFDLRVISELKKLDTDTDKIVQYLTRLVVTDSLDRTVIDQSINASGNSFVSLQSAQKSAQSQLAERIRQSDFLSLLP